MKIKDFLFWLRLHILSKQPYEAVEFFDLFFYHQFLGAFSKLCQIPENWLDIDHSNIPSWKINYSIAVHVLSKAASDHFSENPSAFKNATRISTAFCAVAEKELGFKIEP